MLKPQETVARLYPYTTVVEREHVPHDEFKWQIYIRDGGDGTVLGEGQTEAEAWAAAAAEVERQAQGGPR